MTDVSTGYHRPRPVGALADRLAARRPGPDRLVQLGVRPPPRRHLRVPHRGHRRRPQHPGVLRHAARGDALARLRLGRGPEVGGPHAPYRQSERYDIYADVAARLREPSRAYHCYCTADELEARRKARGPRCTGYDGHCRELTDEQRAAYKRRGPRAGRPVPDARRRRSPSTTWSAARSPSSRARARLRAGARQRPPALHAGQPGRRRADGDHPRAARRGPAVRDAAADRALRRARGDRRREGDAAFGHLPYVMGQGNKKLSKRDPESNLLGYRERGFLPEGLLNYLALLGWAIADDRDIFSMEEMVAAFDIDRVNPNPARFDLKKAEAINAAHLRPLQPRGARRADGALPPAGRRARRPGHRRRARRCSPRRRRWCRSGWTSSPRRRHARLPLRRRGRRTTRPTSPSCSTTRAARSSRPRATRSAALDDWTTERIEEALRAALIEGLGLKPRNAFGPVRVAVTGRRISPPLFESLELLGREESLARLDAAPGAAGAA